MAEHLTPTGRAGIIVPEGIIFQSQTAYKAPAEDAGRKSLVAVISLPAGVFNPYSGVKTSILILDKSLARQSDHIAFFKVENDGFGLGAQRRPVSASDLPNVAGELTEYLNRLRSGQALDGYLPESGALVNKAAITAEGNYGLIGEIYRTGAITVSEWPFVTVAEVFSKRNETVLPEDLQGPVTYVGLENISQGTGQLAGDVLVEDPRTIKSQKTVFGPGDILYGKLRPNLNKVWLADREGICSTDIFVLRPSGDGLVDPRLYSYLFRTKQFNDAVLSHIKGAQLPRVGWSSFGSLRVPLPPLAVQIDLMTKIAVSEAEKRRHLELAAREGEAISEVVAQVWGRESPPAERSSGDESPRVA